MTIGFYYFTYYAEILALLCAVIYGLTKIRNFGKPMFVFLVARLFSVISDMIALLLPSIGINPNHVGNFYTLIAVPLHFYFYYLVLDKSQLRTPLILLLFLIEAYLIVEWTVQGSSPNSYSYAIHAFSCLALAISYFYKTLKDSDEKDLRKSSLFWINTGVIMYFSGVLFVFILKNFLIQLGDDLIFYWSFHNIMAFISNTLFFVGFWMEGKKVRTGLS